jgi:hypothetical protein
MRTKSLFAAAACIAAGVLSSQAQSNVYSLNVVGYVNLTLKPGYNLIANQLKDPANPTAPINVVLTNAPALVDGSTFFGWDAGAQTFTEPAYWVSPSSGGPAWYDGTFSSLVTDTATRGKAYFLFNAGADATLTLVGEVPQGSDVVNVPANYGFIADTVPVSQLIATNGFPVQDGNTITTWDATAQAYAEPAYGVGPGSGGPAWYDGTFSTEIFFKPEVGQGMLHSSSVGSANWTRNFTVQ